MKDRHLVDKRLGLTVDGVADIRRLAKPEQFARDTVQLRFVERTLQIAIQAMLDVALIVCADRHLGEPNTNRELFAKLATDGWLQPEMVRTCEKMAGFRNIVVRQYLAVDPNIVRSIVESQLDDLLSFVRAIPADSIALGSDW